MAFGQELKDFVAGFKTGYDLIESKEDKEWKRDSRRMQKEGFERTGRWHDEDTAYREGERDYRRGRDTVEDDRWNRSDEFRRSQADWEKNRAGVQDERYFRDQELRERDYRLRSDQYKLDRARQDGAIPDDSDIPEAVDPYNTGSIQNSADTSDWLKYSNQSATRSQPLSPKLETALAQIAPELGIQVEVFSGGQPSSGRGRTGSHRHDHGDAADVFIYKDGRKLDWANPKDRPIFEELVARGKQAGLTGFGAGQGYMQPGSMHVGYGTPAVWGAGGSGDTAAAWLKKAYAGNYARGGMVAAIPDDTNQMEEDQDQPAGLFTISVDDTDTGREMGAIPEETEGKTPSPQYAGAVEGQKEAPTDDPYELGRRAVRDGLNQAIKNSGADNNAAIDDPELEKMRQNYIRGYGAAPSQMMRQVLDKIDPDKKMRPGERNMMAMGTVYRYYMEKGDLKQAQEAAASMVQYYRQQSQQYLALAQAAAEGGDADNAAKAAMAAYANVPNGRDLTIEKGEDGMFTVSVTDAKTGKPVERKIMNPRDFAAAAMQFNPTTFDDEIMNAAGVPADKYDEASIEDTGKVEESVRMGMEGLKDADGNPMDPKRAAALSNVASGIASIKQNGMGPQEAIEFVQGLASFNADDPKDDKPGYSVKEVRGNPDLVKVTLRGKSVVMDRGELADLTGTRGAMAGERAKGRDEAAKNAQWWTDQGDLLDKGVAAFGAAGQGAIDDMDTKSNAAEGASAIGGMVPQRPRPQAGAIPEAAAAEPAPSQDDPEIQRLLEAREAILARAQASNKDPRQFGLEELDAKLRELGYDPAR